MRHPLSGTSDSKERDRVSPGLLAAMRLAVAAVWIYEGLWLKMVHPAPHELAVLGSMALGSVPPVRLLFVIGSGEVLLGLGVLSGLYSRFLAWFQGVILVLMNGMGILFAGKAITDPAGLVIHNLPFLLCIVVLGIYGSDARAPKRAAGEP